MRFYQSRDRPIKRSHWLLPRKNLLIFRTYMWLFLCASCCVFVFNIVTFSRRLDTKSSLRLLDFTNVSTTALTVMWDSSIASSSGESSALTMRAVLTRHTSPIPDDSRLKNTPGIPSPPTTPRVDRVPLTSMKGRFIGKDFFYDVILPSITCRGRDVELVICVSVKRDAWARREAIRLTWGSSGRSGIRPAVSLKSGGWNFANSTETKGDIILIFFIGASSLMSAKDEQERVEWEAKIYGDIYQANYIDTYENLTLKSVSILKFLSSHCPDARYMAKVDDDMYLNVPLLLKELRNQTQVLTEQINQSKRNRTSSFNLLKEDRNLPAFAYGVKFDNATVIRNKTSKWYTSRRLYRGRHYPSYLSGTAYAMSVSAAVRLYEASMRLPFFWMEDIFITGLCARAADVKLVGDDRFTISKRKPTGCSFRANITGHEYSIQDVKKIHIQLQDRSLKCDESSDV
ncbi:hypothetical protein RRG08_010117 [Elysia crispata]|uniref:Hexosyltransferase n=1 Tax=Elysia crispata TaxID=231223 RepID=A0AAE0Y1H2_9GAST|nr:hypothetical protein RRG08_010117 [Elysia crispata]